MLKKVLLTGVVAAAVVGTGTAALAATGSSSSPSPSPSAPTASTGAKAKSAAAKHPGIAKIRDLQHASWVTENKKTHAFTTHEAIRGKVGSVSATSITITSDDKVSQTYVVNSTTKVHTRAEHKGAAIADVKVGDQVLVTGTGTSAPIAAQVVDATK